ncbi:MAG: hypothetical protein PVG98_13840 [Chromatiales bacterium]|jgi:hypothetical protein
MVLKPQDVLVVLKLAALGRQPWSYAGLAVDLGMSPSQLHAAIQRALTAGLVMREDGAILPDVPSLEEFLIHGIRYVFVPERGLAMRGMPTAHAAPPLSEHLAPGDEPPPVWPDPDGPVRGVSFPPLCESAPQAARSDARLYELLALVDAIRGGTAREREAAIPLLRERLGQ